MPPLPPLRLSIRHYAVLSGLGLIALLLVAIYHTSLGIGLNLKAALILLTATVIIFLADRRFLNRTLAPGEDGTRYVVAFDAFVFVVAGVIAAVLTCQEWETAILLGGTSLLGGGFFGLLFGYPQGVAEQQDSRSTRPNPSPRAAAAPPGAPDNAAADGGGNTVPAGTGSPAPPPITAAGAATVPAPVQNRHDKNLVAESAATLGKVIAGFSLAKIGPALKFFDYACSSIGPALGAHRQDTSNIVACLIISYFGATGFLSGLFLPSYFMKDQL